MSSGSRPHTICYAGCPPGTGNQDSWIREAISECRLGASSGSRDSATLRAQVGDVLSESRTSSRSRRVRVRRRRARRRRRGYGCHPANVRLPRVPARRSRSCRLLPPSLAPWPLHGGERAPSSRFSSGLCGSLTWRPSAANDGSSPVRTPLLAVLLDLGLRHILVVSADHAEDWRGDVSTARHWAKLLWELALQWGECGAVPGALRSAEGAQHQFFHAVDGRTLDRGHKSAYELSEVHLGERRCPRHPRMIRPTRRIGRGDSRLETSPEPPCPYPRGLGPRAPSRTPEHRGGDSHIETHSARHHDRKNSQSNSGVSPISDRSANSAMGPGTAGDVMTSGLKSASPNTPLSMVASLMRDESVGIVPIVDDESGRLLGKHDATATPWGR
jgi:CBS domain-containing protein